MSDNETFANRIADSANLSKQNAANEAKRLEEKVKAYNAAARNNDSSSVSDNLSNNNASLNKNIQKNSGLKDRLKKKVGSTALQAMGVPKELSDKAMNFAQSSQGQKMLEKMNKSQFGPLAGGLMNKFMGGNQKDNEGDQSSQVGGVNFEISVKTIKRISIAAVPVLICIVFCVLFISASQIFVNAISLGTADSLNDAEIEDKINKKGTEGLDQEKSDQDVAYDIYISDEKSLLLKNSKLNNYNIVQIASKKNKKYNEASLDEIQDFYPAVEDISKNYDKDMVYDFFFKMYNLQKAYNGSLNLPLLMATLNLQSSDKNVVFSSNLGKLYRTDYIEDMPLNELDYNYDWSNYKITRDNSEHDMEILAQHMVSKQVKEKCVNSAGKITQENILKDNNIGNQTLVCAEGETYQTEDLGYVEDDAKYREFLKQFIEKKYYLAGGYVEYGTNQTSGGLVCSGHSSFIKYNLTEDHLLQIASLAQQEQGTAKGAAAEASLMANLFELHGSKYGSGADGLYNYVRNSGWFANSAKFMDGRAARAEVVAAVRSVLIDGKRTMPGYIDEHDYIGDITSVTNSGVSITKTDKSLYIKFSTIIKNRMGSTYTFYSYPDTNSDPFGYTSESLREKKGEFHYDFDTGNPLYCTNGNGVTTLNTVPAQGYYKEWTQCNQTWSDKIVPNSSSTMCEIGCLVTSVSKQIARSGTVITTTSIDPGIAVDNFEFIAGGKFVWDSAKNIAPNFRYYTEINLVGMNQKAVAQKLASYDASRYYIILAVSKKDRDKVHHYVALDYVDLSNNKIYIMDSTSNSYTELYEGYKVYKVHIYEKRD